jgi:hypothetical protein
MKHRLAKLSAAAAMGAFVLAFAHTPSHAMLCTSYCGTVTKWCTQKYVTKKGYKLPTALLCKEGSCPKKC